MYIRRGYYIYSYEQHIRWTGFELNVLLLTLTIQSIYCTMLFDNFQFKVMQSLFISFILTFTSLLSSAHAAGWTLDPVSCKDEKLQQQMRESMTWVFKQANDAFAELNKNPINQDVSTVIWESLTNLTRCKMYLTSFGLLTRTRAMNSQPNLG